MKLQYQKMIGLKTVIFELSSQLFLVGSLYLVTLTFVNDNLIFR